MLDAHPQNQKRPRFFYGWYVLAASFLILFFNSGARFSFGVMFKPMIAEFGWYRGSISAVFFLNMTLFAFSLVVLGRFYDRYGPKWVIVVSTVFLTVGYLSTAIVNSLWQFFISYGIFAAIGFGGTSVPLIAAITSKWFAKWRGLAISLALTGSGVGQFVLIPIITSLTSGYGWRISYALIGAIMFVVNIALALFVLRGDPGVLGYTPFGAQETDPAIKPNPQALSDTSHSDLDLPAAMRTLSFWFFLVVMFICGGGDFLVSTHLIPLVTDFGVSPGEAGQMAAWYGLMSLVGILIAGPASDLIGNKIPISLTFLLRVFLFVLVLRYTSATSFFIFALAFGFTHLITAPLTPTLIGKLYGLSNVGTIGGFITTIHHLAGGLLAYLGGLIFDVTASYRLSFVLSAVMAAVAFFCSVLIRERSHRLSND